MATARKREERPRAERSERAERAKKPENRTTAVEYAIAVVAARPLPEKKLREKIRSKYGLDDTDAAMARMKELRLVDDEAWAERYARDRFERLGKGRHRIRSELMSKGISAAAAEAALAAAIGDETEKRRAADVLEAMRRRLSPRPGAGSGAGSPTGCGTEVRPAREAETLKSRLFRRMLARGYPASLVRDLLDVS
ncbi:MAG: regulatory protein RecX [Candidatus Binatia bacterium]